MKRDYPFDCDRWSSIASLICQANNRLSAWIDQDLKPFGVSSVQFAILCILWHERCKTASELCRELA